MNPWRIRLERSLRPVCFYSSSFLILDVARAVDEVYHAFVLRFCCRYWFRDRGAATAWTKSAALASHAPLSLFDLCHDHVCCGWRRRATYVDVLDAWDALEHSTSRVERGRHNVFRTRAL